MEHWTAGHGLVFVVTLLLVYVFWRLQKNADFNGNWAPIQLFRLGWTGCVVGILTWSATVASGHLGISGAVVALLAGITGLQIANMPAFEQAKEIDKKPREAEKATESEKK